jgi:hypothetical protein
MAAAHHELVLPPRTAPLTGSPAPTVPAARSFTPPAHVAPATRQHYPTHVTPKRRFSHPPSTWRRHYTVTRPHKPATQVLRRHHRFQVRRHAQPRVNIQRTYRPAASNR